MAWKLLVVAEAFDPAYFFLLFIDYDLLGSISIAHFY
jgi:hypothetical protein